jgi:hypothetical protein
MSQAAFYPASHFPAEIDPASPRHWEKALRLISQLVDYIRQIISPLDFLPTSYPFIMNLMDA